MELGIAICAIGLTVIFGIVLVVGIEKGKPWAFEITRSLALIDPHAINMPPPRELGAQEPSADKEPSAGREPSADHEPSAGREPSADKEPSADEKPSAAQELSEPLTTLVA
ncbi:MAG: hypothetical protein O7F71_19330 [Gammaproteobacteria bacterium]|nr:hypothetical protein [Gammaproteobacteria bacterium]